MTSSLHRLFATALAILTASSPPAAVQPAQVRGLPDFDVVDQYLEANRQAMGIPGMALVIVKGDQVVHSRGFGRADDEGRPATPAVPFQIASISKPVAAVAVMQLVEQGKLDLDAPVTRYIPWFRINSPDGGAGITVRHLLNQTSGLPRSAGYPALTDRRISTMEDSVRSLAGVMPAAKLGDQFLYSNANFQVLGLLVEAVSGQAYEAYVRAHILEPLGMTHTYFTQDQAQEAGMAQGYTAVFGLPVPTRPRFLPHATPYYSLVSTAEDLARFAVPFLNKGRAGAVQLLSEQSVAAMTTWPRPDQKYGLGWWLDTQYGRPAVSHGGDAWNFRNELIIWPEDGWAVVLLTNENAYLSLSPQVSELGWGVAALLVGQTAYSPSRAYWRTNLLLLAAALLLIGALAAWLVLLRSWRARLLLGAVGFGPGVLVPAAGSILLGALLLLLGPRLVENSTWAMALVNEPDLSWSGLLFGVGAILAGVFHATAGWLGCRRRGTIPTQRDL